MLGNFIRFSCACLLGVAGLLSCGDSTDSAQTVDSKGGVFTFPNGVVLDIPPDAVPEAVDIEVTDVDCAEVEPILASAVFRSHVKACLGGFSGRPDGLTFAKPITATVPVRPLEPLEIPIQVEFDFVNEGLRIAPTDLIYDGSKQVVEIRNIQHFSKSWVQTFYDHLDESCRTCATYPGVDDYCGVFAEHIWKGQQGGCCLLLRKERSQCEPVCKCCMETLINVESSGVDVSFGECQILGADVTVTYPACKDPTPQTSSVSEQSPECPKDMKLDIRVEPDSLETYLCENKQLKDEFAVTLMGRSSVGKALFGPVPLFPLWKPEDEEVATVSTDDILTAHEAGQTMLEATLSRDPAMPTAEATLDVKSNFDTFRLIPTTMTLEREEKQGVRPDLVPLPGRPPADWPPIDLTKIAWSSDDSDTAAVEEAEGAQNEVLGVDAGHTEVLAEFSYSKDGSVCETLEASVDVTVESGIAGNWVLTPATQNEQCRYTGQEWWEEDPFSSFEINVSWPGGEGTDYIEAGYVPDAGLSLSGTWDETSGDLQLGVDTTALSECGYLFYESDICGPAINCTLVSCRNTTHIEGTTSALIDTLIADANWSYEVTFSYGSSGDPPSYNTWECVGSAQLNGEHQ